MSETDIGRKPITIVQLTQPRCTHRFGTGDCTATGTPCYNTPGSCGDLANLNSDGSIKWRFTDDRPAVYDFADFSDADNIELNPIPCGVTVSSASGEINAGANLDGRANLGVTSKVTVSLKDFEWRDAWGDFSLAARSGVTAGKALPVRGPFWALWTARNDLFNDMTVEVFDGYEGQALADMRQRLHVLDKVDGPSDGNVTLTGLDPLRLASDKKAEFPRTSDLDLYGDIDSETTTIRVFGTEADVSDTFGNTAPTHYLSIGKELISYTGYTDEGDGIYLLAGVTRGALDTDPDEHEDQDQVQRAGRYEALAFWLVMQDLFENHTQISSAFIPISDWDAEGGRYLPTYKATRTIVKPTSIDTIAGQLTQQGLFYAWWEQYAQEIKMLAVRPPDTTPALLTDDSNLIRGTKLTRDPSIRLTQVAVYYNLIDVFGSETDPKNYRNRYTTVDGENRGETRAQSIFAPWVRNRTQAAQLSTRLLLRYRKVPRFLSVTIDAKDRATVMGDVVDIETDAIRTTEGGTGRTRWEVISASEVKAGHTYALKLQTNEYFGRFAVYMGDAAPDFGDATDAEKENGAWYANDSGEMSDGSEGYKYQ